MKFIIKEYLERLRATGLLYPSGRVVPSLSELAHASGITDQTISRYANNHMKRPDIDVLNALIAELRRRGFDTQLSDIVIYVDSLGKTKPAGVLLVG